MTLQERIDEVTSATPGTTVFEHKRSVIAPNLVIVELSIESPIDEDVSSFEQRKLIVKSVEGVEVATWWNAKPTVIAPPATIEDPNPGPQADNETIIAFIATEAAKDSQKVAHADVQRRKTVAYVNATVTDGIGFFHRTWLVSEGEGKGLEAVEQKVSQ